MSRVTSTAPGDYLSAEQTEALVRFAFPDRPVDERKVQRLRRALNSVLWRFAVDLDLSDSAVERVRKRRAEIAEAADKLKLALSGKDGGDAFALSVVNDVTIGDGRLAGVSSLDVCRLMDALSAACCLEDPRVVTEPEGAVAAAPFFVDLVGALARVFEAFFQSAAGGGGYDESKCAPGAPSAQPDGPFIRFALRALRDAGVMKANGKPYSAERVREALRDWRKRRGE